MYTSKLGGMIFDHSRGLACGTARLRAGAGWVRTVALLSILLGVLLLSYQLVMLIALGSAEY
jgi:hypothetical protein